MGVPEQCVPPVHVFPQQSPSVPAVVRSQPFIALPSQSAAPPVQVPMSQTPPPHAAVPFM